jgi:hypothetical protein
MYKVSGCGLEEAAKLPTHLILCHLEDGNKVGLAVSCEPHLNPVSQDRHDHCLEDLMPPQEGKTANRVPKDPQSTDCALSVGSKGLHVQ